MTAVRTARTVEVAPGIWCRWARQDEALRLPVASPASPAIDAPAWRRREHVAGRRLLAALLADVAPEATGLPIELRPDGKPELPGLAVGISIAHSHPMVAAAVATGWDVGVDVEAASDGPDLDRRRRWTVREACVKATGAGLAGRPWKIPVPDRSAGQWRDVRWRTLLAPAPLSVAWLPQRRPADQPPGTPSFQPSIQRRGQIEP
jgi:4'-phosphopantetheinyl transferase